MKYIKGDLLDMPVIAHGCNKKGVMGAGVAKLVRDKFPNQYFTYRAMCQSGMLFSGDSMPWAESGTVGFNLITQNLPGANANIEAIAVTFQELFWQTLRLEIKEVFIPRIGCGIGGLTWEEVGPVLEFIETNENPFATRLTVVDLP